MKIVRIHADDAGETAIEPIRPEWVARRANAHEALLVARPRIVLRSWDAQELDLHNAPERRLLVMLDGSLEIESSRGHRVTLGPGDVLLAEDVDGRGHRARWSGERGARMLMVLLDEPK